MTLTSRFRCLLDLQLFSITRSLRRFIETWTSVSDGKVVLDVGCGEQPFRALFDPKETSYFGLEVPIANDQFGMSLASPNLVVYDGHRFPIRSHSVDLVLLIEVLEHVQNREQLLLEVSRVLREGGVVLATVPWSARVHYEPYDFVRFTPFGLEALFNECGMTVTSIQARGTTLAVVANKMLMGLIDAFRYSRPSLLLFILLLPIVALLHVLGFAGIFMRMSSHTDPLGYTLTAKPK